MATGLLAACGPPAPPSELGGLWSRSLAACAAGLGVTFRNDAVRARFGDETLVLLAAPRYEVRPGGANARVRIYYSLPRAPGGVRADLGRGVIELERTPAGRLTAVSGWFTDLQTGAAHVSLAPGPLGDMLSLGLCPRDASVGTRSDA